MRPADWLFAPYKNELRELYHRDVWAGKWSRLGVYIFYCYKWVRDVGVLELSLLLMIYGFFGTVGLLYFVQVV